MHIFLIVNIVVVAVGNSGRIQIAGEDYTLTCTVTGGGNTYQWFRNGSPLISQTSAILSFSPLRQTDNGSYTCEAMKSFVAVRSTNIMRIAVEGDMIQHTRRNLL